MKVLLWQDVDKVGRRGQVVDVKAGFARNFLFPRKLASEPTDAMVKELGHSKRRHDKQEAALISEAGAVAEKLAGIASVSIEVNTNDQGHLYGAVTPTMIVDALRDQGIKLDGNAVEIAEPIKQTGTFEVTLALHRDVRPKLKVWVLSTKAVKTDDAAKKPDTGAQA
jgi:large subunit ribosomal protein L9